MLASEDRLQGFTLIQLMIAVAIIGILFAAAFPAYRDYIETGRERVVETNIESLRLFLENFFFENRTYIEGTYDPNGDTATLPNALGWTPEGDQGQFVYTIDPCDGGNIQNCYKITVKGFDNAVSVTYERPAP